MTDSDHQQKKATIVPFTAPRLEKWAKAGGGEARKPIIYRDSKTPGLLYLVRGVGQTSFAFESKLNKKTIRIVFDKGMELTLGQAQDEAIRLKGLINQGIDPRVAKAKIIQEQESELAAIKAEEMAEKLEEQKASVITREAWECYLQAHQGEWGERHFRDHVNLSQEGGAPKTRGKGVTVPGVLSPVLAHPIARLDAELLREWLREESKARANNARQGFETLRAFWKWVAKHPDYKDLVTNPRLFEDSELLKAKPKRRAAGARDVLEKSHLSDWFIAVQGLRSKEISVFLQCLLLLGCRRNELLGLKWEHIETRAPANAWIHDKVEQAAGRHIPLGPYAMWLIESLPKREWTDDKGKRHKVEWVFSSAEVTNQRIHHDSAGAAHARALSKAEIGHVSIHGLRRSYSSLSEWLEIPTGIVAQIQGHKPSATAERHYKRRPLELLSQWHCKFEAWMLEQAGIEFKAEEAKGGLRVVK